MTNPWYDGWKDDALNYTGVDEWNAVYTVSIGELQAAGVFDWTNPLLDWSSAAYDEEQYERVCNYFIERFYYREISIEPFEEWARTLKRKLVYELMPKYKPLYERANEGFSPLAYEDEYYKSRVVSSEYPETILSGNSDYLTDARDEEYERIKEGNLVDAMENYRERFRSVDQSLLDELESMFISMYTTNINATW